MQMRSIQTLSALALALCLTAAPATAQYTSAKPKQERVKFDPTRDPAKDLAAAIKKAQKENKRILLDVGGEWCGWCKLLDNYFIEKKEIGALLNKNYVLVKVNYSEENKNEAFLGAFPKITGYPHFFVLEKDGKFLHSQDTALLEEGQGYSDEKMTAFLKKWSPPR
jgi:thiol:disulfide interchange protein